MDVRGGSGGPGGRLLGPAPPRAGGGRRALRLAGAIGRRLGRPSALRAGPASEMGRRGWAGRGPAGAASPPRSAIGRRRLGSIRPQPESGRLEAPASVP